MANRTQTFAVTFPANTPAGTQEKTIQLDRKYAGTNGLAVYVNSGGGVSYVRLGLRDDNRDLQNLTNVQFYQAGIDCPKPARFTPVDAVADGTNLYVQVQIPETLTAELNLDVVFNLFKKD